MTRFARASFTLILLSTLAAVGVPAQTEDGPPVHYRLLPGSTYQQGCWEPCDCPLLEPQPLSGTFELVYLPVMGPIETRGVAAVDWSVPTLEYRVTGSGMLQLLPHQQRLVLDLGINDDPVQQFDSGFVPEVDPFPAIDVVISMNQFYCYDIVMRVRAEPVPVDGIALAVDQSTLSWNGVPDASYDAVCGELSTLRGSDGDFTAATDLCLANDHAGSVVDYALTVQPGEGAWFLVRGTSGSVPLTYDSLWPSQVGARDPEIDASSVSCP